MRFVVPERLRDMAGRREFNQSCRTHKLVIAKLVAAGLLASWRRQLLDLGSQSVSSDVLKLLAGSPALSGRGWVTVANAVAFSGVTQDQLMREAADGVVKLFCRMSRVSGVIVPIGALGLQRVIAVPGVGRVTTDPAPQVLDRDNLPAHSYSDARSGAVPIFESSDVAQQVLAGGLTDAPVSIFNHDDFSAFVTDVPMLVASYSIGWTHCYGDLIDLQRHP